MADLRLRIDSADPANSFHPPSGCLPKQIASIVGIPAIVRLLGRPMQGFDRLRKRHLVRLADAHVDQFHARIGRQRGALRPLDFFELVDFGALAVGFSTNTVGKEVLDIRIAHNVPCF